MAALSFTEHMSGTYYLLAEPLRERKIALDFEAHLRKKAASVTGRLRAEGLASSPVQGTIDAGALADKRIPYDLSFVGDDGRRYRLRGEKDLSWLAPIETLVVLHFTIGTEDVVAKRRRPSDGELEGRKPLEQEEYEWTEVARGTMRTHADAHSVREMLRSLRASPF